MREPPGPCGAGRLRCTYVFVAECLCLRVGAGGRRPAREIATHDLRSEWSISKPGQALPPPTGTAAGPSGVLHTSWAFAADGARRVGSMPGQALPPRGLFCWAGPLCVPVGGGQAPHPAITHNIPAPTPNFACNSPTTVSNLESTTSELQRFQTLLKLHPIELHATFA